MKNRYSMIEYWVKVKLFNLRKQYKKNSKVRFPNKEAELILIISFDDSKVNRNPIPYNTKKQGF